MSESVIDVLKENVLGTYSTQELGSLGLEDKLLQGLQKDFYQPENLVRPAESGDEERVYSAALVLNYIVRRSEPQALDEVLEGVYVSLMHFCDLTGTDMIKAMSARDGGRELVVEYGEGDERDYGIAITDIHKVASYKPSKRDSRTPTSHFRKPGEEEPVYEEMDDFDEQEANEGLKVFMKGVERNSPLDIYLKEISKIPLIDREREREAAREGDLELLVKSNLRFVVTIAKKYQGMGVELVDLISAGNEGMTYGAKKFDYTQGVKFISYAVWWIRQRILTELADHGRNVRIPLNRANLAHKIDKEKKRLLQEDPTKWGDRDNALTEQACINLDEDVDYYWKVKLAGSMLRLDHPPPLDDGSGTENYQRFFPGDLEEGQEQETYVADVEMQDIVLEAIGSLEARDAKVLKLYFGLDGHESHTLEEIGAMLGLTRERIRQVRDRAMKERLVEGRFGNAFEQMWSGS